MNRDLFSSSKTPTATATNGAGGVAFGPKGLAERETEQRVRGVGRDMTTEKFGTGHAQPFDLADECRKMTIESLGKRTSIE